MKRCIVILGLLISTLFAYGCNSENSTAKKPQESSVKESQPVHKLLATIPDRVQSTLPDSADKTNASTAQNLFQVSFSDRGQGVAYIIESAGSVHAVLNGNTGKPYRGIGAMVISPDGQHIAYSANIDDTWRMVSDAIEAPVYNTIAQPVFSPDSRHLAYDAQINGQWHIVVGQHMSAPIPQGYNLHDKFFSSDSSQIFFIEIPEESDKPVRVSNSDIAFKHERVKEIQASDFVLNNDKTRIALIAESKGKKKLVEFAFNKPDAVSEGRQYDSIQQHTYGADGATLAYVAEKGKSRFIVLNDKEEPLPYNEKVETVVIRPDKRGAGIIFSSKSGYFVYQAFTGESNKVKRYMEAANLIYTGNGKHWAYTAKKAKDNIFMVVDGIEGPVFDMIVTPMFSPDGTKLVYRARKDGKRFVVVADAAGKVLRQHPAYEMVYQPSFTTDGKSIAYGVKDGQKLIWKVEQL